MYCDVADSCRRASYGLHGMLDAAPEKALRAEHGLSVVEYAVLEALGRQDGWHMRMQQLARATALSGVEVDW